MGYSDQLFLEADGVILEMEGITANDRQDPGGETKWGIARVRHLEITDQAWAALTFEQARNIRKIGYWVPSRCGDMPWELALVVYDDSINHGGRGAARRLQLALGVSPDGVLGSKTLAALPRPATRPMQDLIFRFMLLRAIAYSQDSDAARFLPGWLNRLVKVYAYSLGAPGAITLGT